MKTRSALPYFGSDGQVAFELGALFDKCNHVAIPFVGGASIIPFLKARTINAFDLNNDAINFYQVVKGIVGDFKALVERCEATLSHPRDLELARLVLTNIRTGVTKEPDATLHAWAYWCACWLGRKGKGGTVAQFSGHPSIRRTGVGGNNATRLIAAATDLHAWANQFKRVEFGVDRFQSSIGKVKDIKKNGLYLDPPWFGPGDSYFHRFNGDDHVDLRRSLDRFQEATIVVRYGDAPEVRALYSDFHIFEAKNRVQSNAVKSELWISNQDLFS